MIAKPRTSLLAAVGASAILLTTALLESATADVTFLHALDDSPLDLEPIKGEELTDVVKSFRKDGVNPYNGQADAISAGQTLFDDNCQACHGADGSGGMGPSLVDQVYSNKRANTDVGMFEIIHSGASGAMRSFSERGIKQDEILKIIAYIHTLKK